MIKASSYLLVIEGKLIFKPFVLLLIELPPMLLLFVVWMLFFFLIGNKKVDTYLTEQLLKNIILSTNKLLNLFVLQYPQNYKVMVFICF